MFFVPRIAMPHVIAALTAEIAQESDMIAWVMGDDDEEDWPEGYDPNDLPLFDIVLRALVEADSQQLEQINLSGKPLAFMVIPLPEYLRVRGSTLAVEERQALEDVLERRASFERETVLKYLRRGDRPGHVPPNWVRSPTTSSPGFRWDDPGNPGNSVRIFEGDPSHENPARRAPFVIVLSDGHVLDRSGAPVSDQNAISEALEHR